MDAPPPTHNPLLERRCITGSPSHSSIERWLENYTKVASGTKTATDCSPDSQSCHTVSLDRNAHPSTSRSPCFFGCWLPVCRRFTICLFSPPASFRQLDTAVRTRRSTALLRHSTHRLPLKPAIASRPPIFLCSDGTQRRSPAAGAGQYRCPG